MSLGFQWTVAKGVEAFSANHGIDGIGTFHYFLHFDTSSTEAVSAASTIRTRIGLRVLDRRLSKEQTTTVSIARLRQLPLRPKSHNKWIKSIIDVVTAGQ